MSKITKQDIADVMADIIAVVLSAAITVGLIIVVASYGPHGCDWVFK